MRNPRYLFALIIILLISFSVISNTSSAQPNVDITLVDNGNNELEVRVRPDGPFDGIFSSSVFTIRWNTSDNADLGFVQQSFPESSYQPINKSGDQFDTLGYRYQIFAGFSTTPMNSIGIDWVANMEYTIMTIPVLNGSSTFEIVNDSYTAMSNGDFYISLAGLNRTGIIYQTIGTSVLVGPAQNYNVNVLPNPNNGEFSMQFTTDQQDDYSIELVNSVGQVIYSTILEKFSGDYKYQFDLTSESTGVYFLKVSGTNDNTVHRIVVE